MSLQPPRGGVDTAGAQEVLGGGNLVDHLLAELERRLLSADVDEETPEPGVASGQHLVHECEVEGRHEHAPRQNRRQDLVDADPAGPHGRDLVVGGQVAEGVEHRQQHRHGEGHGNDERQAQCEDLADHTPGQALSHQRAELLGDLAQEHQAGERPECEQKGRRQLAEEVATEQAH